MQLCLSISVLCALAVRAVQKLPDPPEEEFQEEETFISDLVPDGSELWVLCVFCVVLAVALAVTLCPCSLSPWRNTPPRLSQLETPLFREKYIVSVWKLNKEGTVRILRRKAIL